MTVVSRASRDVLIGGVDMGGTKILVGLGDKHGKLLAEVELATEGAQVLGRTITCALAGLAQTLDRQIEEIAAVVIGGAGVAGTDGRFEFAPNILDLADQNLSAEIAAATGATVLLENDVNIAAIAELIHSQETDFCFVSLGTGVGMGIVVNGTLVRGSRGAAGEIGLLPIVKDPFNVANQRRGAFEEAVAGETISSRYFAATQAAVTPSGVFGLAAKGDVAAIAAIDDFAKSVAQGLSAVTAIIDPALIILGGGIGRRPDLLPRIRHWIELLGVRDLQVRITTLGPVGPVLGALHLASEHVLKESRD